MDLLKNPEFVIARSLKGNEVISNVHIEAKFNLVPELRLGTQEG
jgi:hypothetical protein